MKQLSTKKINHIRFTLFIACLLPLAKLILAYLSDAFGPDPVAEITHATGLWSLKLMLATLALSPLRKLTGWNWLVRLRRMMALYAFFYAGLHFLSYIIFDHYFDWVEIGKDIAKRPYLMAGLVSFVLMIPLAITSTTSMLKRLGGRNWQILHRLSYLIAAVGVLHYFWLVKRDISNPSLYAVILLALFYVRILQSRRRLLNGEPLQTTRAGFMNGKPAWQAGRITSPREPPIR